MALEYKPKWLPTDRLFLEQDPHHPNQVILDIYCFMDGKKHMSGISHQASAGWLLKVPYQFRDRIRVATKTAALYKALQTWPEGQIHYQSARVKESLETMFKKEGFLEQKALFQAAFKQGKKVKIDGIIPEMKLPLKDYQKVGAILASSIYEGSGYALFMEQRTGKTPTAIGAMTQLAIKNKAKKALIIVPPILKLNWKDEFNRFCPIPVHAEILKGQKIERVMNLFGIIADGNAKGAELIAVIVPYDTFVSSYELIEKMKWDTILCDESHWFKDPKTARSKHLLKIRKKIRFGLILTGTPVGNSPVDLYTQLEFLEEGSSRAISLKDFKDKTVTTQTGPNHIEVITGLKDCSHLKPILAERAFIVKRSEVMKDLPPKVYEFNSVEMGKEQTRHYKELQQSLCTQIKKDLEKMEGNSTTINHILTQLLRLAQVTAGYIVSDGAAYYNEEGEEFFKKDIHFYEENFRLDRLVELAKELPEGKKMIIWNHWIPMIDRIFERFEKEGMGENMIVFRGNGQYGHKLYNARKQPHNDAAKDAFNDNKRYRFFLASAQSANVGLTLPGHPRGNPGFGTLCDEMVYFSYNWSYLQRAQSEDRPYETSSKHQLRVTDLLVEDTIDQEILFALRDKKEVAEGMTNLTAVLKHILESKL